MQTRSLKHMLTCTVESRDQLEAMATSVDADDYDESLRFWPDKFLDVLL